MASQGLSVFWGEDDAAEPTAKVRLKLRDIFPVLVHAHRHNAAWLKDLADDQIVVTEDFAEVVAEVAELLAAKKSA